MDMTIAKWGNSLGVRIPREVAKAAGVKAGSPVRVNVRKGVITLEPIAYNLASLVAGISPDNLHGAVETGPSMGSEAW